MEYFRASTTFPRTFDLVGELLPKERLTPTAKLILLWLSRHTYEQTASAVAAGCGVPTGTVERTLRALVRKEVVSCYLSSESGAKIFELDEERLREKLFTLVDDPFRYPLCQLNEEAERKMLEKAFEDLE